MESYRYSLGITRSDGRATIVLHLHSRGERIKMSTKLKVHPENWDADKEMVLPAEENARYINDALTDWSRTASRVMLQMDTERWTIEQAKERILEAKGMKTARKAGDNSLILFYHRWATTATSTKKVLHRHDLYSWRVLKEFRCPISFADVDYQFYMDFCSWMDTHKKFKANTKAVQIQKLKAVMNAAYKLKLHDRTEYRSFEKVTEEVDNVYLTNAELDLLWNAELPGYQAKARDIFLIGCYTAMRWSDFSRLKASDITEDTIYFTHKKTGYRVTIPLHPRVKEILARYGGSVPQISDVKLNEYIKEVCRDCGIDRPVTRVYHKAGCRTEETVPKWKMVSSHTGRRTAATNMIKAGIPAYNVMMITGHKSEKTFWNYVKVDKEDNAELIRSSAFFR